MHPTLRQQSPKAGHFTQRAPAARPRPHASTLRRHSQEAEARRDELSRQLDAIADFGEDLTRLRTQHEMLFKGNAEAFLRLRVRVGGASTARAQQGLGWVGSVLFEAAVA